MADAVRRAKAEGGVERSIPSALDEDEKRERSVKQFFEQLPIYRDASPLISQLWRKSKTKRWEPTDEELSIFFATVREIRRRAKRDESIAGLIDYEEGTDLPSAMEDGSFDLLD